MITIMILASLSPQFYYVSINPPGKVFSLIHNHIQDYFFYLHLMKQGQDGYWALTSRYTPEHFPPQLVQTTFAILGKFAVLFGNDQMFTYILARTVFGIILAICTSLLAFKIFKKPLPTIIASYFAFFSTGLWRSGPNFTSIIRPMEYWTEFDALNRATFLPHHLLALIFMITLIILYTKDPQKWNRSTIIKASFCGFLIAVTNPATLITVLFSTLFANAGFVLYKLIKKEKPNLLIQETKERIIKQAPFFFASGIGILILYNAQSAAFPWNDYKKTIANLNFKTDIVDFIFGIGPTMLISFVALILLVAKRYEKTKLTLTAFTGQMLLFWLITPFIGVFGISKIFPRIPNSYFFQSGLYIISSIFTAFVIYIILGKISNRVIRYFSLGIACIVCSFYFYMSWQDSYKREINRFTPNIFNIFIDREIMDGFAWLDKNTPYESVVVTGPYTSLMLPSYTHNRVHSGYRDVNFDATNKEKEQDMIFKYQQVDEIKKTLAKYPIRYIFTCYDAPAPDKSKVTQLGLTEVFHNNVVTIYQTSVN